MQRFYSSVPLDDKVYMGNEVTFTFFSDEKTTLRLTEQENKYVIELAVPWGNIYKLNEFSRRSDAEKKFSLYQSYLAEGYPIHITSFAQAEIVRPGLLEKFKR